MPYLSSFERGAVERAAQSNDDWRNTLARVEKMTATQRLAAVTKAKAALASALKADDLHLVRDLAERLSLVHGAVQQVEAADVSARNAAACPARLPQSLPSGARVRYGHWHGRTLDSGATHRRHSIVNTMNYCDTEPKDFYYGVLDGQERQLWAQEIDWIDYAKRKPPGVKR